MAMRASFRSIKHIKLALLCVAVAAAAASPGHIYALTKNGTSNLLNVVDVDLGSWETRVGPSLPSTLFTFGQAAL